MATGTSSGGRDGKSRTSTPPSRVTRRGPLFEENVTSLRPGSSFSNATQAEPNVAWPHRSTSLAGVIQRIWYSPPPPTM